MKSARLSRRDLSTRLALLIATLLAPTAALAAAPAESNLKFRKPEIDGQPKAAAPAIAFRALPAEQPARTAPPTPQAKAANPLRKATAPKPVAAATAQGVAQATYEQSAQPLAAAPRVAPQTSPAAVAPSVQPAPVQRVPSTATTTRRVTTNKRPAPRAEDPIFDTEIAQATFGHSCDTCCEPECGNCEVGCGCPEPACGVCEPECGIGAPACGLCQGGLCEGGCAEPVCGCPEPACGCAEPDCGMVGCGSCVGNPGPDYWCFPVCLPRFKELSVWGGVQGFKGPRDYLDGRTGESNFGFNEGINIGGRAPLVGLVFPQVSCQLGYRAVQSQLSGTLLSGDDRSQQFVTAGLFRRVKTGLQFGCVWDMMRDDLIEEEDFHQLRYEIGLKGPEGREIGFWGASATNNKVVSGIDYEAVGQYCGFIRWHFRDGGAARIWGGGTDDREGIVGADFMAPLSTRWSIQGGFNYLIPDATEGPDGAREESWNVGLGLVWHLGCVAKNTRNNPYAPMFPVADNGWMFIDQK